MLIFIIALAAFEIVYKLSGDLGLAMVAGAIVLWATPTLTAGRGKVSIIIIWPLDSLIRFWYSNIRF